MDRAAVAKVDPEHPPLFLVEEWEFGDSEVAQILLDEDTARQIWAKDQKEMRAMTSPMGQVRRTCGTRVRRWVFTSGAYQLDPDWPPVGRRTT